MRFRWHLVKTIPFAFGLTLEGPDHFNQYCAVYLNLGFWSVYAEAHKWGLP